jgi:hypothetical protein
MQLSKLLDVLSLCTWSTEMTRECAFRGPIETVILSILLVDTTTIRFQLRCVSVCVDGELALGVTELVCCDAGRLTALIFASNQQSLSCLMWLPLLRLRLH